MAHKNDLEAMLGLPLDSFVRSSYRLMLKREADAAGFESALIYLKKSGRRIVYLQQLAVSSEAAQAKKPADFCDEVAAAFAAVRAPVIGARRERAWIDRAVAAAQSQTRHALPAEIEALKAYFAFRTDRTYDLDSYYHLNGVKFIRAAYASICDRLPSPGEEAQEKAKLRRGISKAVLLSGLLRSFEGRSRGTRVDGASMLTAVETVVGLPVVGHVLMLVLLLLNLNNTLKYIRAMEYKIYASFNDEEG